MFLSKIALSTVIKGKEAVASDGAMTHGCCFSTHTLLFQGLRGVRQTHTFVGRPGRGQRPLVRRGGREGRPEDALFS